MPVCHKCKHQREIDRLREICAACPGASDRFGGNVHFQASPDGSGELVLGKDGARIAPEWAPGTPTESRVDVPPDAREYLFRLLREFSQLTDAADGPWHGDVARCRVRPVEVTLLVFTSMGVVVKRLDGAAGRRTPQGQP